jgi:hypothetical protein
MVEGSLLEDRQIVASRAMVFQEADFREALKAADSLDPVKALIF